MSLLLGQPRRCGSGTALIDARQYVLDSDWGDAQPRADADNEFLEKHAGGEYAEWHLGLTAPRSRRRDIGFRL
jgi:hypothetical protein